MNRTLLAVGSFSALLSVAFGAFGAHALELTERFAATYQTAADYHMAHSLALLLIAAVHGKLGKPSLTRWSGRLIAAGIIIFSGSLYLLSITETTWLGAITPLGGLALIAGWALLGAAAVSGGRNDKA